MVNYNRKQSRSVWYLLSFLVWLVINIRVEAGIGTVFERALDGLVGILVLLISIILALRFFNEDQDGKGVRRQDR